MILQPLLPMLLIWAVVIMMIIASVRYYKRVTVLRAVGAILVIAMFLNPTIDGSLQQNKAGVAQAAIIFVVDATVSMKAQDYDGDKKRMVGVQKDIKSIAKAIPGAQYSVISFNHEASIVMPSTMDVDTLNLTADTLQIENPVYSQGSAIDEPIDILQKQVQRVRKQYGDYQIFVVYMGDGEQTVETKIKSFAKFKDQIDGGGVLGYGTARGGPMRIFEDKKESECSNNDSSYCWVTSRTVYDKKALSKIDEKNLNALAKQMGVGYLKRASDKKISEGSLGASDIEYNTDDTISSSRTQTYFIFANLLLAISLAYLIGILRQYKQARDLHKSFKGGG